MKNKGRKNNVLTKFYGVETIEIVVKNINSLNREERRKKIKIRVRNKYKKGLYFNKNK